MDTNGSLTLDVLEKVGGSSPATVGVLSLGSANQRLTLRAKACSERLAAVEVSFLSFLMSSAKLENPALFSQARIQEFSSQTGKKLLQRIETLQALILGFRRQVKPTSSFQTKDPHADSPPCAPLTPLSSAAPGQPFAGGSDLSGTGRSPVAGGFAGPQRRRAGAAVAERCPASLHNPKPSARPQPAAARVSAGPTGTAE